MSEHLAVPVMNATEPFLRALFAAGTIRSVTDTRSQVQWASIVLRRIRTDMVHNLVRARDMGVCKIHTGRLSEYDRHAFPYAVRLARLYSDLWTGPAWFGRFAR